MREVLIGQTDYTVLVKIIGTDGAPVTGLAHTDIDIAYARVETDNDVTTADVAPADLANLTAAHSDWGWEEVSQSDHPGLYRLDVADAVFASGAWEAVVTIVDASGTDFEAVDIGFRLVSFNAQDGVRLGLTALPNAAADGAGGLVISDAGGFDVDNRAPSATSVGNMNVVFATDFAANYNTTNDGWVVKLGDYAHGGSSANTTFGTLTTGAVSVTTVATSGTVTFNALTVSNATTLTGAVSLGSTLAVTGAITATNASNNLRLGTFTVDTNEMTWNSSWDTEVQSEVDDAIIAKGLDHLVFTSVAGADVADDSIIAKMVSKSATADWDSFTNTTDALEGLRDRGDAAWITANGFSTHSAADVWAVATRVLTAATNITSTGGTITVSAGAVTVGTNNDKTGYALSSSGLALVVPADPSSIPVLGTASIVTWIGYFGAWTVNEVNSDSNSVNLRNSADNADLAAHATSDDGTTFSSGEPA